MYKKWRANDTLVQWEIWKESLWILSYDSLMALRVCRIKKKKFSLMTKQEQNIDNEKYIQIKLYCNKVMWWEEEYFCQYLLGHRSGRMLDAQLKPADCKIMIHFWGGWQLYSLFAFCSPWPFQFTFPHRVRIASLWVTVWWRLWMKAGQHPWSLERWLHHGSFFFSHSSQCKFVTCKSLDLFHHSVSKRWWMLP